MNDHLKAAIDFSQVGADHLDNGRTERGMEYLALAQAAAAIAQAESAERQAVAAEWQAQTAVRQTIAMEQIAQTIVTIAGAMGDDDCQHGLLLLRCRR